MHVNKYVFIALLSLIEQASIMGRQVQQLTWLQGSTASIGFWRTERIGKLIEIFKLETYLEVQIAQMQCKVPPTHPFTQTLIMKLN